MVDVPSAIDVRIPIIDAGVNEAQQVAYLAMLEIEPSS